MHQGTGLLLSSKQALDGDKGIVIYSEKPLSEGEKKTILESVRRLLERETSRPGIHEKPSRSEIIHLLRTGSQDEIECLFRAADLARQKYVGEEVHIRGLIEASNICENNCLYCGIRRDNSSIKRYRLSYDEIFDSAALAFSLGYRTVVIQTGESGVYPAAELCRLIERVKKNFDLAVTLSLGELEYSEYAALRASGADRYLMRFETSDRELFKALKPEGDFDARMKRLGWLRELGYQVGSGIMIGLPGQTLESVADDIMLFSELELDMVGAGPFIVNPDTPLVNSSGGGIMAALKLIALTRLVTLDAHIPATTALATIDPEGRQKALRCGANVIMPNCTPGKYRKHYLLYPDKICLSEEPSDCAGCVKAMVESCGRKISTGPGHSLKHR
jgi:biotin synthase